MPNYFLIQFVNFSCLQGFFAGRMLRDLHTVKPVLSNNSKRRSKIGFQDQLLLNADQGEHSAILSTFIKLPFVIKIFVLSIFEWPLKTGLFSRQF